MKINTLSRNQESQGGFTLIELMLVLAIVGILAVVAVPKYRSITEYYHLQSSVQTVSSSIRYAKQRALDEHKVNYVGITPTNIAQVALNSDFTSVVQSKALDAGVTLQSGTNTFDNGMIYVYFDNRGYLVTNMSSDTATFKLKGSSNRTVDIDIDLLGNVSTVWN